MDHLHTGDEAHGCVLLGQEGQQEMMAGAVEELLGIASARWGIEEVPGLKNLVDKGDGNDPDQG